MDPKMESKKIIVQQCLVEFLNRSFGYTENHLTYNGWDKETQDRIDHYTQLIIHSSMKVDEEHLHVCDICNRDCPTSLHLFQFINKANDNELFICGVCYSKYVTS